MNITNIAVINGPNLNLLGAREPNVYGTETLDNINGSLKKKCSEYGADITFFQSNHEGDIIGELHRLFLNSSDNKKTGVVLNAGAFTHYSYAIRDAIAAVSSKIAVIEVHMSNVHAREEFRHASVISPVCRGVIVGFGSLSYSLAVQALLDNPLSA